MDNLSGGTHGMPSASNPMLHMTVSKMTGDMRFVGVFSIIYGALTCLGIITAVVGVPLIIAGLRLREAADSFTAYLATNDGVALQQGFERQAKYFFIQKVFLIIALVLVGLYILFVLFFLGSMFQTGSRLD